MLQATGAISNTVATLEHHIFKNVKLKEIAKITLIVLEESVYLKDAKRYFEYRLCLKPKKIIDLIINQFYNVL